MLFFIFILSVCEKIRMGSSNGFNKEDINALDIQVILSTIDVISLNYVHNPFVNTEPITEKM